MKKSLLAVSVGALVAGPVAAMDVATFLREADALEEMGARAMFSDRARVVMAELNQSNRDLREERLAAQASGRRPAYCPDTSNRTTPQEIVAALRTIPTVRRPQTRLRDALRAFYARRYPCPA
jgi:hypothetical protein